MTDLSDVERAAIKCCLKAFGAVAAEIGFSRPLGDYTEEQALRVIEAIVTRYTQAMVEHYEANKYPPVRGAPVVSDPMEQPFAGILDGYQWEES